MTGESHGPALFLIVELPPGSPGYVSAERTCRKMRAPPLRAMSTAPYLRRDYGFGNYVT
jgi:hypothetical protein